MLPIIFAAAIALAPAHAPVRTPEYTPAAPYDQRAPAFRDETFQSAALGRPIKYRVLLPDGYDRGAKRFPVLYLLHGLEGHFDDWSTRTDLAERVRSLPLIVVMPEGADSWYTNAADASGRFEDYIATDLVHDVEAKFRAIRARYGRVIAGLSMGGYGAVKIALKHPGLFQAAVSLSGAFDATDPPFAESFPAHTEAMGRIFGSPASDTRRDNDVFALAGKVTVAGAPAIYVACGESDRFLASNRRLVEILQKRGFTYEYHETAGAHGWDYWNRQIVPLLAWVRRQTAR
jgi:S-formylglutathione hydrolase FrmB